MPLLVLPALIVWSCRERVPAWIFMWTLSAGIYAGCKWLTWRRASVAGAPAWKHAGYLLAWPGLDADRFLAQHASAVPDTREWMAAWLTTALGLVVFFGAARWMRRELLAGWLGMIGVVLTLHFGVFHVLSCAWRGRGVDARPLMNSPLRASSLGEFWGRRWNTAFRDLTHRFLFRPLMPWLGARGAIGAGFLFSGVVHDLVISVPARGGFGGPTLFFCIQAAGMLVERTAPAQRLGLGRGRRGWLFAMAVLAIPVPALFHPPFVRQVIVPFMRAAGAL
jgi:hypothetical protein